jgi:hypothetical protein
MPSIVSRYTYLAPMGRSTLELMSNYKLEFHRLGFTTLYEKTASEPGWFGPFFSKLDEEDGVKPLLGYNESDERVRWASRRTPGPPIIASMSPPLRD